MKATEEVLLVHPGGLGDVCLSESTFLSLREHFGKGITAVGNRRVLGQFSEYFGQIDSMDSRAWMPLFADIPDDRHWQTIILIGKDRSGVLRRRLSGLANDLVFVEMYPDRERMHVDDYQLSQLPHYGIEPLRLARETRIGDRLILYPEDTYQKKKWPAECFVELSAALNDAGIPTILAAPRGLRLPHFDLVLPDSLSEVSALFSSGGLFFSNDSGMAHFAARCGLFPLTVFSDTDPVVWRPVSGRVLALPGGRPTVDEAVCFVLSALVTLGFPKR